MDIFMDNSWLHVWEYKKTRSAFLFKRSLEYNVRSLVLSISAREVREQFLSAAPIFGF